MALTGEETAAEIANIIRDWLKGKDSYRYYILQQYLDGEAFLLMEIADIDRFRDEDETPISHGDAFKIKKLLKEQEHSKDDQTSDPSATPAPRASSQPAFLHASVSTAPRNSIQNESGIRKTVSKNVSKKESAEAEDIVDSQENPPKLTASLIFSKLCKTKELEEEIGTPACDMLKEFHVIVKDHTNKKVLARKSAVEIKAINLNKPEHMKDRDIVWKATKRDCNRGWITIRAGQKVKWPKGELSSSPHSECARLALSN